MVEEIMAIEDNGTRELVLAPSIKILLVVNWFIKSSISLMVL